MKTGYLHWMISLADRHANLVNATAALAVAFFTFFLWRLAKRQNVALERVERAYINLSHVQPGVVFLHAHDFAEDGTPMKSANMKIQVKNSGNTPARVETTFLTFFLGPPAEFPDSPKYTGASPAGEAFLVAGDDIAIDVPMSFPKMSFDALAAGTFMFAIYGYVDYEDAFGVKHRSGYGRKGAGKLFAVDNVTSALVLEFIPSKKYNFDVAR